MTDTGRLKKCQNYLELKLRERSKALTLLQFLEQEFRGSIHGLLKSSQVFQTNCNYVFSNDGTTNEHQWDQLSCNIHHHKMEVTIQISPLHFVFWLIHAAFVVTVCCCTMQLDAEAEKEVSVIK